jgi:hypothetical protein
LTRLLISAGTEFNDRAWAFRFLDGIHAMRGITAVLHLPAAEALASDWALTHGLPIGAAADDLAGVDVVAALPGPVPARAHQNRLEVVRPDHLVVRRGPDGRSRTGIVCIGNVTHAITGTVCAGPAIAVQVVDGGQVRGEGELQPCSDGRWTGLIVLDGVTWAAAGMPRNGRLLAELVAV